MGLKNCEIIFDNRCSTYYAGQTVKGTVNFAFDAPKKIRGISIKFKGEANTRWIRRKKKRGRRRTYSGNEEYFKVQYYLLGAKTGEPIELPAGTHSYPFTCALPSTLPSSFEGLFGHIRYTVKVTLDRPWKFDQEYKTAFTIVSTVDLNLNANVKDPFEKIVEKSFGCWWFGWCCASGSVSLVASLPYTGYVSGQEIPVSLRYENASNVLIHYIKFELIKIISFHSQHPKRTKQIDETIWEHKIESIQNQQSDVLRQPILIPPLPPSHLNNCGIIDLDYEIRIHASFRGLHTGGHIKIPIVLGTIPLASRLTTSPSKGNTVDNMPESVGQNTVGNMPESNIAIASTSNSNDPEAPPPPYHSLYPTIPLPTYTESEFKAESIEDTNDNEHTQFGAPNFAPRYPVFNLTSSMPLAKM